MHLYIDFFQRLYHDINIPFYLANKENLLKKYNSDLFVIFDEPSGTLSLRFAHIDSNTSQEILKSLIKHSDDVINQFSKENALVALKFIEKQRMENKVLFVDSIKTLIEYQNNHNTIDPNLDVEWKSTILANLEGQSIQVEQNESVKPVNKGQNNNQTDDQKAESLIDEFQGKFW